MDSDVFFNSVIFFLFFYFFFFKLYGDHRDLHKRSHSFPTRRSSDLDTITSFDLGPCNWSGDTSGSRTMTSSPALTATPLHQKITSQSDNESQKWFSPRRRRTGSLMIPPSGVVRSTYLHSPTAHFSMSRGVSICMNSNPSGPSISTCRSTPTSHKVTWLTRCQYSSTGSV